ncbi:MAG: hypothetical protein A3H57_03270 [Candidatus Taylorbacteria bacterium RIFCSPLOWO2_02_FULL_43_11]|uniref:Uncharacterized protein n=1 Tax=Candidatus Taylorbacteria bacterium RIFCSPHIGHO2_02_FULL_43_32b TaxID=1802306 RepID=A0A1G2MFQ5_9BACT|nr:MAG: hypothetical protein A2743_00810 [Candidatus Taylorbacteria bacterium RIFCSPHIGHO2_01_FULL_43_47]OHA22663.1 MAG: hypothetical protein A3C72_01235 [Candidatus Taylorbacteria bacterium RIFCSPHIGHO2_02_FULL_43_32b]OHA29624.1 MAG: hypothetical protein A3B08_03340 [Candidatus Taylorbacteria bacterium RIFCSPLOWO2_01_FULL_43_44]OHA36125.1 MAG: hypothetical protein A3H57_03270 [Candidatus Taylorbacteria bacterium RIFCSPLOWO2_02_FULL_43_11]
MSEKVFHFLVMLFCKLIEQQRRIRRLERDVQNLRAVNADFRTKLRNLSQIRETLGDDNRLYAAETVGQPVDEKHAWEHYEKHDGPENFAWRQVLNKCLRRHRLKVSR